MIGRLGGEALEGHVGTRGAPGRSMCKPLNVGDTALRRNG